MSSWLEALAVLCVGVAGCSAPDCEELCEESKECPESEDGNCAATCRGLADLASVTGCVSQLDDFIVCAGDAEDICNADACAAIGDQLLTCELEYCLDHAGEPTCAALGEGCSERTARTCHTSMGCAGIGDDGKPIVLPDCAVTQLCADGGYSLTCEVFDGPCVCKEGEVEVASVAYLPEFCEPADVDVRVAFAKTACGWP